jgi:hypothetical protein
LSSWPKKPTPAGSRQSARFRGSYAQTLKLLEKELRAIDANHITIEAEFSESQIRNDGLPRAGATPAGPAVCLHFEKGKSKQVISLPCDTFRLYTDNLKAIALSLEALRKVDRYGVTQGAEQYKGFMRLEAPDPKRAAKDFFVVHLGVPESSIDWTDIKPHYAELARKFHPDRGGEFRDLWDKLNDAYTALNSRKTIQL